MDYTPDSLLGTKIEANLAGKSSLQSLLFSKIFNTVVKTNKEGAQYTQNICKNSYLF